MEINVVDDVKDLSFTDIAKLAIKIDNSNRGTVNRLDIESLDEAIPGIFIDDKSGWSFKHLPNGISSVQDNILNRKLREARIELDEKLNSKMANIIKEMGGLASGIVNIINRLKSDGIEVDKNNILLDNISKLHLGGKYQPIPLIGNEEYDAVDLTSVKLSRGEYYNLVESTNPELNRAILNSNERCRQRLDNMLSIVDIIEDEYNGIIIKKFTEKSSVTATDVITILTQPTEFILYLEDIYNRLIKFISRAKEVSSYQIDDNHITNVIDLDNTYSELVLLVKDKSSEVIIDFIATLRNY